MTKQKRKKSRSIIYILFICFLSMSIFSSQVESSECKKYDVKCKAKKWVGDTKNYQNKKFQEGKKQLNDTKNKMIDAIQKNENRR